MQLLCLIKVQPAAGEEVCKIEESKEITIYE